MNTTGIQNYLSNVFRPIVVYDPGTTRFTPKLELSNIDTYSGNTVAIFTAAIGDANNNVYVGSNAGNLYNTLRACCNVTAIGYAAGSNISNDSNSVYVGSNAGAGNVSTSSIIGIGAGAGGGGTGVSNIFIGTNTRSTLGSSNIFLGHGIDLSSVSSQIRIGFGTNTPFAASMSQGWVGLGGITSPYNITYSKIDLSGNTRIQGNLGLNIEPGTRTLDVNGNFRAQDSSSSLLDFSNGITRCTGGYVSSNGTISGTGSANTVIGTLKKGIIFVSVQDAANSTTHFASSMVYCSDPTNGSYVFDMSGSRVNSGDVTLDYNSSNIRFSNAGTTRNFGWSITYLPVP